MPEPSVTVPVSLATRLLEGRETVADLRNLRALLAQQTPTAEPYVRQTTQPGITMAEVMRRVDAAVGKPPRIEDLAPGTTFTAEDATGRYGRELWVVQVDGLLMAPLGPDTDLPRDSVDPSTIRDVTPPKDGTAS